jgi:uncharacterized membrane protein
MDDIVIARGLHVLAVVIWIGGLAMVTTVVLPAIRRGELGADRLKAFQDIERRFVPLARVAIVVVGATGFYMAARQELWQRFQSAQFWWMHAMVGLWLLFAIILFLAEPLILHRAFDRWATATPDVAFRALHRAHWVLFALALITIFGAVAGSQGWSVL